MAIKKSEIYSQLWAACDKLRGGVEPARYKDYILTLLFMKYVSDRYNSSGKWDITVPEGGSFDDIRALKHQLVIGVGINQVIGILAKANNLEGVITNVDFASEELGAGREAMDKLTGLVEIFEKPELNFTNNRAGGDDILGDAYEYLMRKFAQDSGKSKGQFYTPGEVSRVMAGVTGIAKASAPNLSVYDPACGSGSLLIRAADAAPVSVDLFGQEIDPSMVALARMNLVLHNKGNGDIRRGSTLKNPQFLDEQRPDRLKQFDFVVVNPPFSDKSWMDGMEIPDQYQRFGLVDFLLPPEKNGDYAWLLHVLASLKPTGKAAVILPHGVLFRGNNELEIRKDIIDQGYLKGIIGLPPNLFFGTGIPACILVLDKENCDKRRGVFMLDAGRGFFKDGSKNRLREQDIRKIISTFNDMDGSDPSYARFVPNREIKRDNGYNLSLPRYLSSPSALDIQDIDAHLNGGIPVSGIDALEPYWQVYPSLKSILFTPLRPGYYSPALPCQQVVHAILTHPECLRHAQQVDDAFRAWKASTTPALMNLTDRNDPKLLIQAISQALMDLFVHIPLLDQYDVYQVFMEYWAQTMEDDVYLVCYGGYEVGREIDYDYLVVRKKKGGQTVEIKTDKVRDFDGRLIPKQLLAIHFFPHLLEQLDQLQLQLDEIQLTLEELAEEQGGEGGLLSNLDEWKRSAVESRIRLLETSPSAQEELTALRGLLEVLDQDAAVRKRLRQAQSILDEQLIAQYGKLSLHEIKQLLVEEKWFASIHRGINAICQSVSHRLADQVAQLVERYTFTLQQHLDQVSQYEDIVKAHLERMGFVW